MKIILYLVVGLTFSFTAFAQKDKREHLKCHLQLEDKSIIVHQFVNTDKENKEFIEALLDRTVFMADGIAEKKIIMVYECVDVNRTFRSKDAIILEKNTPF